jgi:hypothetical protein
MLSKKQADIVADELLNAARERRERKAERNLRFPDLLKLPFAQRIDALRAARDRSWRHPAVVTLCLGNIALAIYALRALWQDDPDTRTWILATVGVFLIMQFVHRRLTRKVLRSMIRS